MNSRTIRQEYLEKLNIVVEYINNNLDKKITISKLSRLSNISQFHFHRIIKSLLGEPVGNYITRTKVETASVLIRYTNLEINEIAFKVGYENASSLNRVFKKYYNISPTEYRNNKAIKLSPIVKKTNSIILQEPKIITIPDKNVIYLQNVGVYEKESITNIWNKLSSFVEKNNLFYNGIENFGISYDDPSVTAPDKCRYEACFTLNIPISPNGEIGIKKIKGGKFAVFTYKGSYTDWEAVYDYIFDCWLVNSNYNLRNLPIMEKYLTLNNNSELNIEIFLPITKFL